MNNRIQYRGYTLRYNPKPIPDRRHDYDYVHEDYDGPPDPRCGRAGSVEEAKKEIDELEDEEQ